MNDRLGDLFGSDDGMPAWAVDDGGAGGRSSTAMPDNEYRQSNNGKKQSDAFDFGGVYDEGDIEFGEAHTSDPAGEQQPKYMESFFKDVDAIKADVDAIRDATKRVGEINEEAIKATTTAKEEELSRLLKPLIDQTNKRAKRTKNLLALLKEENQKLKQEKEVKASDMR